MEIIINKPMDEDPASLVENTKVLVEDAINRIDAGNLNVFALGDILQSTNSLTDFENTEF